MSCPLVHYLKGRLKQLDGLNQVYAWVQKVATIFIIVLPSVNYCPISSVILYLSIVLFNFEMDRGTQLIMNLVASRMYFLMIEFQMQGTRLGSSDPKGCFSK